MWTDIITTAIERPGVFLVTFVVPALVLCYIGMAFVELYINLNNLRARKQARDQRAKEYWRIFRRK